MREPQASDAWTHVDETLRELARHRATHEYMLGRWLLAAARQGVHQHLGYGSVFEYADRVLFLTARGARERIRVARALEELPLLREALREGFRPWAAVRELSRVAVPETEQSWLDASAGRRVREVEAMVRHREPGAMPSDAPAPGLVTAPLRLELGAEAMAMYRDTVAHIRRDAGGPLSEEQVLLELCRRSRAGSDEGRSGYQVELVVCASCERTWQQAGGEQLEVPASVGERAQCDAQVLPSSLGAGDGRALDSSPEMTHVGHGEAPGSEEPERRLVRATQSVPPAVRRSVLRRAKGGCEITGCNHHLYLDVHHIRLRSEGGLHTPDNLAVLCGPHHGAVHDGALVVERSGSGLRVVHIDGTSYGAAPSAFAVHAFAEALSALRDLDWREGEAKQALLDAATHVGRDAPTTELVMAALRRRAAGTGHREQSGGAESNRTRSAA